MHFSTYLPPHEKGIYMSKAKDSKMKTQMTIGNRITIGEDVAQLQSNQKGDELFLQNMFQYIESTVCMVVQHIITCEV
jgi:hypothetical protein